MPDITATVTLNYRDGSEKDISLTPANLTGLLSYMRSVVERPDVSSFVMVVSKRR